MTTVPLALLTFSRPYYITLGAVEANLTNLSELCYSDKDDRCTSGCCLGQAGPSRRGIAEASRRIRNSQHGTSGCQRLMVAGFLFFCCHSTTSAIAVKTRFQREEVVC
jgi:hypothetical protein